MYPEMSAYFLAGFRGGGASRLQTVRSSQKEGGGVERYLHVGSLGCHVRALSAVMICLKLFHDRFLFPVR